MKNQIIVHQPTSKEMSFRKNFFFVHVSIKMFSMLMIYWNTYNSNHYIYISCVRMLFLYTIVFNSKRNISTLSLHITNRKVDYWKTILCSYRLKEGKFWFEDANRQAISPIDKIWRSQWFKNTNSKPESHLGEAARLFRIHLVWWRSQYHQWQATKAGQYSWPQGKEQD